MTRFILMPCQTKTCYCPIHTAMISQSSQSIRKITCSQSPKTSTNPFLWNFLVVTSSHEPFCSMHQGPRTCLPNCISQVVDCLLCAPHLRWDGFGRETTLGTWGWKSQNFQSEMAQMELQPTKMMGLSCALDARRDNSARSSWFSGHNNHKFIKKNNQKTNCSSGNKTHLPSHPVSPVLVSTITTYHYHLMNLWFRRFPIGPAWKVLDNHPDVGREAILRQVCMSTPVAKPRYLRHPRRNSSIPGAEERNHGSHATGSTPWPQDSSMTVVSLKMRHFSWHQETPWDEGDCWCHRHQLQHFQTVWFEPPIEPLKMPGLSVPIGSCTTRVIDG